MSLDIHFSTGKDDWETPLGLFIEYDQHYHFVLDAAANEHNRKVDTWLGPGGAAPDSLEVSWQEWLERGNIWLNPPYSRGLQPRFVRKASKEALQCGGNAVVVCLLPARTDTKLFHEIIKPHAKSIEFLRGRVRFLDRGLVRHPAPFPSMIVVF